MKIYYLFYEAKAREKGGYVVRVPVAWASGLWNLQSVWLQIKEWNGLSLMFV